MPPWSTRSPQPGPKQSHLQSAPFDGLSISTSSSGSLPAASSSSTDRRGGPGATSTYPPLLGVPSLSPTAAADFGPPTLHSSPTKGGGGRGPRLAGHSRSVSNPFPSLFGSGGGTGTGAGKRGIRRGDDELGSSVNADADAHSKMANKTTASARKNTGPQDEGDFVTGSCATCDSTVRWPRHLDVYRCTVCQMVNDLKPGGISKEAAAAGLQKVARKGTLGVSRVRWTILMSVVSSLDAVLGQDQSRGRAVHH